MRSAFTLALSMALSLLCAHGAPSARAQQAGTSLPPPPERALLDETGEIGPEAKSALEELLVEHDGLTGEQIVFALVRRDRSVDLREYAKRLFAHWQVGQRGKATGLLIAGDPSDGQVAHELGYGLSVVLPDERVRRILEDVTRPRLKDGDASRAFVDTAAEILRALGSPLIESGRMQELLEAVPRARKPEPEVPANWTWTAALILGLGAAWITLQLVAEADAHYTGSAWSRVRPGEVWRKLRKRRRDPRAALGGTHGRW